MSFRYLSVNSRQLILFCFVLVSLAIIGCSSIGTMHTARPLPTRTVAYSAGVSSIASANAPTTERPENLSGNKSDRSFDDTLFPAVRGMDNALPAMAFQVRYGLHDRFDAGMKITTAGVGVDLNLLVFDSSHLAMSIDPEIQFLPLISIDGGSDYDRFVTRTDIFWLPVLFDVYQTDRVTVTLGARGGLLLGMKMPDSKGNNEILVRGVGIVPVAGASVGWKVRQSKNRYLIPEIATLYDIRNQAVHIAILIGWTMQLAQ